jgi:tRNA(fMet)-specific endonuclease VapC
LLDYNRDAADWHASERARLVAAGKTPPFVDSQIAAIARVNGMTLVTSNMDDFREFEELKIQSWV